MEEKQITEIEQDLNIDKNNLDFELMDQPKKFMKYSIQFAEALQDRDEAKRQSLILRSNTSLDIRSRPDAYGLAKATEGSVNDTIEGLETVKEADKKLSEAQYSVNIFSAAKEAFDQRKTMLERLVSLYISGYYSEPRPKAEEIGKLADKGTEFQKELLQRRKRII